MTKKAGAGDTRRFIERGLDCYQRGELPEAIAEWEQALLLEPGNGEARELIAFVRDKLNAATPFPELRPNEWTPDEKTNPELEVETLARVRRAEKEADKAQRADRAFVRRATVESTIPSLLARTTVPGWETPTIATEMTGSGVVGAVPQLKISEETTRKITPEAPTPIRGTPIAWNDTPDDTPTYGTALSDLPGTEARAKVVVLAERCRVELDNGQLEMAAIVAEEALTAAENAPHPGIAEVVDPARALFERVFEAHVGPAAGIPVPAMPLEQLAKRNLDSRAGFLLSRMDGIMTLDQVLEISGMSRGEALRILSALLRMKALRLL